MTKLTGPRSDARSGEAKSLVVLLHGYGADGNDLIGLAQPMSEYLPDTVFRAPNAHERCTINPMGYQWFPIPWIDGSSEAAMKEGFLEARGIVDAYLTEAMDEEGIAPARTAVVGFSQGTMVALDVVPRRAEAMAGIVGFSGRLADDGHLADAPSKPPVVLVHGDQDEVIPIAALPAAHDALKAAGFEVYAHVSRGIGHGIAPDGLGLAVSFLRERFGLVTPGARFGG